MYLALALHEWKRIRRSAEFHKNLGTKIFWGFLIGLLMLEVLVFGILMGWILKEEFPGRNPVTVFNSFLLAYCFSDLLMRIMGQKLQTLSAKPYLILPVPRGVIVRYLMARTMMTLFNVLPLLFFVPVSITVVGASEGFFPAFRWTIVILLAMWMNCFIAATIKTKMLSHPKAVGVFIASIIAVVGLGVGKVIPLAGISSSLFDAVVYSAGWLLVPVTMFSLVLWGAYGSFSRILHLDSVASSQGNRMLLSGDGAFFDRWNDIGRIILLDLRMLMRNRRSKPIVVIGLLMVFYGIILFRQQDATAPSVFLLLIGFFITGTLSVSYGSYTFSWESTSFGVYATRPLAWERFLQAKYILMSLMTAVAFILSGFYAIYGWQIVLTNAVAVLFNIGVSIPLMLWLGTFSRLRFDLDANAFSAQGKTGAHFGAIFLIILIISLLYLAGWLMQGPRGGIAAVAFAGILGIIGRKQIILAIAASVRKRKYRMVEGFRQR